jgi:hypothetical protein
MANIPSDAPSIKKALNGQRRTYAIDGHPCLYLEVRDGNGSFFIRFGLDLARTRNSSL